MTTDEPKWTPGPWVVKDNVGSSRRVFMPNDRVEISTQQHGGMVACLYVNAHLIAAAPDLYEALEAVDSECLLEGHIQELVSAAISKARGES